MYREPLEDVHLLYTIWEIAPTHDIGSVVCPVPFDEMKNTFSFGDRLLAQIVTSDFILT